MTETESIWRQLEQDAENGGPGIYLRRILPQQARDVHLCIRNPDNRRSVVLGLSAPDHRVADGAFESAGISVVANSPDFEPHGYVSSLEIQLADARYMTVFGTLSQDVISVFEEGLDESSAVIAVIRRLNSWQRLLARARPDGLTPEQQRGLYGELDTLMNLISPQVGLKTAIESWTGPDDRAHDFVIDSTGIEVKTTIEAVPSHIRINSEFQLDDSDFAELFLLHVHLSTRLSDGQSLPGLVEEIRLRAVSHSVENLFERKLIDATYFDGHKDRYSAPLYSVLERTMYQVENDFPRLTPSTLPAGVDQTRYVISVNSIDTFKRETYTFSAGIRGGSDG